jgi:hypothetical protein
MARPHTVPLLRLGIPRHTRDGMAFDGLNYDEFGIVCDSLREAITWRVYRLRWVPLSGVMCVRGVTI